MKSRTSTRTLAIAATTLFFAGSALADDTTTTAAPTGTTGTGTAGTSTANTGTIVVTGTSLPEIVTETEPCAVLCYNAACLDSGCNPADFDCVCGNPHSLVVKMGLCVGKDCDNSRQFDSGDWIADVCSVYDKSPSSADLARASSLILAEISSAAATATDNPMPSTGAISNGGGTTSAGAASTGAETSSAAASMRRALGAGSVGGLFGATSIVVGLLGGATVLVAGVL